VLSVEITNKNLTVSMEPEGESRWVRVVWNENTAEHIYSTDIIVSVHDRTGIVVDIATLINSENVKVSAYNATPTQDSKITQINISFDVRNLNELHSIIGKLMTISGVVEVQRSVVDIDERIYRYIESSQFNDALNTLEALNKMRELAVCVN